MQAAGGTSGGGGAEASAPAGPPGYDVHFDSWDSHDTTNIKLDPSASHPVILSARNQIQSLLVDSSATADFGKTFPLWRSRSQPSVSQSPGVSPGERSSTVQPDGNRSTTRQGWVLVKHGRRVFGDAQLAKLIKRYVFSCVLIHINPICILDVDIFKIRCTYTHRVYMSIHKPKNYIHIHGDLYYCQTIRIRRCFTLHSTK